MNLCVCETWVYMVSSIQKVSIGEVLQISVNSTTIFLVKLIFKNLNTFLHHLNKLFLTIQFLVLYIWVVDQIEFILQNCLIISFLRFIFTLVLLLSWRKDRAIFVDGNSSITNSHILFRLTWRLEQSSFVMSFLPMHIARMFGFFLRVGRMLSTVCLHISLHKVSFGI